MSIFESKKPLYHLWAAVLVFAATMALSFEAAAVQKFGSARGFAARVQFAPTDETISETGYLNPAGSNEATLMIDTINIPSLLISGNSAALTISLPAGAAAGSVVNNGTLIVSATSTAATATITFQSIQATARGTCEGVDQDTATVEATTTVGGNLISINGSPIAITGEPNQTITLPDDLGFVVINEHTNLLNDPIRDAPGVFQKIIVNGLHVHGIDGYDAIISQAEAAVKCEDPIIPGNRDR